jgi:hypothetical protein
MKQILKTIIAALTLTIAVNAQAIDVRFPDRSQACNLSKEGDPFPWLFPLEIPWSEIQGTWKTQGEPTLFVSIQILGTNEKGARYVKIQVLKRPNEIAIASGVGFVPKKERILESLVSGSSVSGQIRIASLAFPMMGCSKYRAETAVQVHLFDKRGKELIDEVMFMKKEK